MGCCTDASVRVSKMALEMKSGPMLWYKRRLLGRDWRDVHAVLYNDSTLAWFGDKGRAEQQGGLVVKEAPELVACGRFTAAVPDRPPLPPHYGVEDLVAFGIRGRETVHWFLCPNQQEVESWMTAISNTLPPPPETQLQQPPVAAPTEAQPPRSGPQPLDYGPQPQAAYPPPPPQYTPQPPGIPGQYPPNGAHRPPLQAPPPAYFSAQSGPPLQPSSNTTVVVQDRGGYNSGGGGGDFAMGVVLGGALGATWGHAHGHGFGWGHGAGWGGGSHAQTVVNDTDIHVNNYYDCDSTVVNNAVAPPPGDVIAQSDVTAGDLVGGDDFEGGNFGSGDFGDCSDFGF